MADAYTSTTSLDFSQKAYNRRAAYALRPNLMYDQLADKFATEQSMPGVSVQFNVFGEMAIASTPLLENQDVTAASVSDTTVTATLNEYGNVLLRTRALQGTSFIEIDPALANLVGFNAGVSIDEVARLVVQAGSNVAYPAAGGHSTRATITSTDLLQAHDVRLVRAFLARNNAMPFISGSGGGAAPSEHVDGGMGRASFDQLTSNPGTGWFASMIHPDVSLDLREQTGSGAWRTPKEYNEAGDIWAGELGAFEGFRFVENSRAPYFVQGGSGSQNVYGTLFLGMEAILKIWATVEDNGPVPQIVQSPIVDRLRRFRPIGWYWFGAFGVYRQNCLYRIESASTSGGTTATEDPTIDL